MIGPLFKSVLPLLGASLVFACGTEGGNENNADPSGEAATGGESSSGGGASGGTDSGGQGATGGDTGTGGTPAAGTGGTSASGATGGTDDGGAAGAGGDETADFDFDYNAPVETHDPCANTNVPALPVPVDMYIMLDSSGSMVRDDNNNRVYKWENAVLALKNFFKDPQMAGNGVALQEFSGTGCGARSNPAVQMQDLPGAT